MKNCMTGPSPSTRPSSPYREYSRLLGIDSIDEYIRYGGTLRAGELAFDDEDVNAQDASFRDDESTRRYIDTGNLQEHPALPGLLRVGRAFPPPVLSV